MLHLRHLEAAPVTVDTSLRDCVHDSVEALLKVGTQLRKCRYKFLRRWAQYSSHSGAQGWEINQYQTGWIRASALRLLFLWPLFLSLSLLFCTFPSTNWRKATALCMSSVCLSFSMIAISCIGFVSCYGSLGGLWEDTEDSVLLRFVCSEDRKVITRSSCGKVLIQLRVP